jgi:hypothetical protein
MIRLYIQICMRVYDKWYVNLPVNFCICCKLLIISRLFLVLLGNKRAMYRLATGFLVWGLG